MKDVPHVLPDDVHNRQLVANVHPADWSNPEPADRYNLVVLGAGTAGLISAAGSAGLGAKVALVERELMGGDCLNVGCVPSKALIRSAHAAAEVRDAARYGVQVPDGWSVDFPAVMERLRRLRASISPADSAARYRSLGVDVYLGSARFTGPDTVEVGGKTLRFRKAIVATGARASRPDIPGLEETGYLTNETVFSLTELPRRLAVIGAGPIGCELAQAFARFGSAVTLLTHGDRVLDRDDPDASALVEKQLRRDGIQILARSRVLRAERLGTERRLVVEGPEGTDTLAVDAILVGVGRTPNVENMGLEAAGVEFDLHKGIRVDDRLRSSNSRIFAAGDVCSAFKFTHAADAMARIAIQNSLFMGRARVSALVIPRCTYTDPEVGHVGLTPDEAAGQGIAIQTITQEFHHVDRAILDGDDEGFLKLHVRKGTDRVVGATIVARHAGEMLAEVAVAVTNRVGLKKLARTIHAYPTQAEAVKRAADAFNRTRLTPRVKWLLGTWLSWTR